MPRKFLEMMTLGMAPMILIIPLPRQGAWAEETEHGYGTVTTHGHPIIFPFNKPEPFISMWILTVEIRI